MRDDNLQKAHHRLRVALGIEKSMTAYWYQRMSGEIPWKLNEKESYLERMEAQTAEVNRIQKQLAAIELSLLE